MKFTCPHCGEKTFGPLLKARCGIMSSDGKPCPECGVRCVNGKVSIGVHIVLSLIGLVIVIYNYFNFDNAIQFLTGGVLPFLATQAAGFLFDMFFGKLIVALKRG